MRMTLRDSIARTVALRRSFVTNAISPKKLARTNFLVALFLTTVPVSDDLGTTAQHEKQIGSHRVFLNHILIPFEFFEPP